MSRLLLLLPTGTYRAEAFLDAAQKLGLEVTVATEKPNTLEKGQPTGLLTLDFDDPEAATLKAVQFAKEVPFDMVLGVDDATTVVSALISSVLSLPHHSVQAASAARNKYQMRELLSAADVPVPRYRRISVEDDPGSFSRNLDFPCVVKPLILSASRGVIRANDSVQFIDAFRRLKGILEDPETARLGAAAREILVEDFVPGQEVALEGLVSEGELRVLALFDKPDPLDGPFFEETIYLTPSRLAEKVQAEIVSCADRALKALGLREGPVHAELRVNPRGPWVIEISARSIGGRCSKVLRFGAGMSLEEVILRHVLRMELITPERDGQPSGVMMIPVPRAGTMQKILGQDKALSVPGIEEIDMTTHKGQKVRPLPEGVPSYLGFIFARGDRPEDVENALREARRRLEFEITPSPPTPGDAS